MDWVYVVKPDQINKQLRFSLRSLAENIEPERVVIAGYKPKWVANTGYLQVQQKFVNLSNPLRILKEVCAHPQISETFVLMNDDFFAMQRAEETPPLVYDGYLDELYKDPAWSSGWHRKSLEHTMEVLDGLGVQQPYRSYDRIHRPIPMNKAVLAEVLGAVTQPTALHRSLYGNLAADSGEPGHDAKCRGFQEFRESDWISTSRTAWTGQAGQNIRTRFKAPCIYEK